MILLTSPVTFAGETDNAVALASASLDLLNNALTMTAVYGQYAGSTFTASHALPAVNMYIDLSSGFVYKNGAKLAQGLDAASIAAVGVGLIGFHKAVETELTALGIFSGTVS